MKEYLSYFMDRFDYPKEAVSSLLHDYERLISLDMNRKTFMDLLSDYEEGKLVKFPDTCELFKDHTISDFAIDELLLICMTKHLKKIYQDRGYSINMWDDACLDLKYKLIECHDVKGIWGSFVADWEMGFLNLTLFGFGRLQFEIVPFELETYTSDQVNLKKGDPVISVHIPQTGTSLLISDCYAAYEKALEFFAAMYPQNQLAFVVKSWILYPPFIELYSEGSNLLRFASDYKILTEEKDQSMDDNMWRIFASEWSGNIDDYKGDTSLRRKFKQYLKEGGFPGQGYGIFFCKTM